MTIRKNNTNLDEMHALMEYLKNLFATNNVPFEIHNNNSIKLDPANYSKVFALRTIIDAQGYSFKSVSHQYLCCVFLKNRNAGFIQLVFTLNHEKYISSTNQVYNDKVLEWGYEALIRTVDSYEYMSHCKLHDGSHHAEGRHPYMPYNINWFLHHLQDAYEICMWNDSSKKHKFLEVGCSVGTKTKLASQLFQADALEVFQPYAEVAKELTRNLIRRNYGTYHEEQSTQQIFVEDALTFTRYNEYDVIYFYCPFNDYDKEVALEKHFYEQVKIGTVLILLWNQEELPRSIRKTSSPSGHIYVKLDDEDKFHSLEQSIQLASLKTANPTSFENKISL